MKNITLIKKEKLLHKVKFSMRIILIDLFLMLIAMAIAVQSNYGGLLTLLLSIFFFVILIKTFFDLFRIFFNRVYITNKRVIFTNILKTKDFKRLDIVSVYYRSSLLDFKKNMTSFKFLLKDGTKFKIKNVKNGKYIVDLLSEHIFRFNKQNESSN